MLKVSTLIALFICIVYSNNEHNIDSQLPPNEFQVLDQTEQNKKTLQTVKGYYTEEKKSGKLCKQNDNRRLNDDNPGVFESLPITATIDHEKTVSSGDRFVTESIHGTNYNYKTKNIDRETDNNNFHGKNCGCDDCMVEAKVLEFESLALATPTDSNTLNDAPLDFQTSESQSADNNSNLINKVEFRDESSESEPVEYNRNPVNDDVLVVTTSETELDAKNNNLIENDKIVKTIHNGELVNNVPSLAVDRNYLDNVALNTNIGKRTRPCNKENINGRRKKCGKIDVPDNLSSSSTTRRILPGIINNPTKQEFEDNKLYQNNPQSNSNNEIESRQIYYPNVHKVSNSYDIDLVHNMNINDAPDQRPQLEDASIESQLIEPTKGKGIYDMKDAGVMLLENSRVCYACSTMSDPTCWSPDRRTTVKYCRKGHQSCLTKSFKHKGKSVIIRDCGSQCVNQNGEENYSSCSICHSDLCNGASSMRIFSASSAVIVLCGLLFNKQ